MQGGEGREGEEEGERASTCGASERRSARAQLETIDLAEAVGRNPLTTRRPPSVRTELAHSSRIRRFDPKP